MADNTVTLDTLSFEIVNTSKNSTKDIDTLINKLNKLKSSTLETINVLTKFNTTLEKINDRILKIKPVKINIDFTGKTTKDINDFTTALSDMYVMSKNIKPINIKTNTSDADMVKTSKRTETTMSTTPYNVLDYSKMSYDTSKLANIQNAIQSAFTSDKLEEFNTKAQQTSNLLSTINKNLQDNKFNQLSSNIGNTTSTFNKFQETINGINKPVDDLRNSLSSIEESSNSAGVSVNKFVSTIQTPNTISFANINEQIAWLGEELKKAEENSNALTTSLKNTSQIGNIQSTVTMTSNATGIAPTVDIKTTSLDEGNAKAATFIETIKKIKPVVEKTTSVFSKLGNIIKKVGSIAGGIFGGIKSKVTSMANSFSKSVSSMTKKLGRLGIALLGVRGLFTAVRKSISAYMSYDDELSKQLQNNWAVLGSLLAPILERLIALFSTLVSYINAFIKTLFGIDLVAKANAKALNKASGAAKGYADELAGLMKFDDLNVANFDEGSSGGGSGVTPLTVEDVDITPIDRFLEFLRSKDWYGIGMEIGRLFNEGLRSIDFDSILETTSRWARNMADLFNGLTDGIDWALLGETISNGFNTIFGTLDAFISRYNFGNLGTAIGTAINSSVETFDWQKAGQTLGKGIQGIFQLANKFVKTTDWKSIGKNIGTFINNSIGQINFVEMGETITLGLQGIFDTVTSFIKEFNMSDFAFDFNTFFANIDAEALGNSVNNFLQTIVDAAYTWFDELDWQGIGETIGTFLARIDWLKIILKLLYIALIGLPQALGKLLSGVVMGALGQIWDDVKRWWNTKVQPVLDTLGTLFVKPILSIVSVFKELPSNIGTIFTNIKDGISRKIGEIVADIQTKFSWTNIKATFINIKDNIVQKFTDIKDGIKEKVSSAVTSLKNFFSWDNIKTTFVNLVEKIKEKFGEIGTTVGTVLSTKFNEIVSKILNKAVDMINGFVRALNKAITVINKIPGVELNYLSQLEYPKLETGTNQIEVEGLYHLHEGEAVVPKKYNPAINNQMYEENSNRILQRLDKFMNMFSNMENTTNVYVGDDELYSKTTSFLNRQTEIYGTDIG